MSTVCVYACKGILFTLATLEIRDATSRVAILMWREHPYYTGGFNYLVNFAFIMEIIFLLSSAHKIM